LRIDGLTDIFNRPVPTKTNVKIAPPPKSKDAATEYLMLGHTAEVRKEASFSLDAKFAEPLGRARGFFITPAFLADLGNDEAQSKNTIKGGLTAERTFARQIKGATLTQVCSAEPPTKVKRRGVVLEAHRVTPAIYYETDRDGTKKNFLPSFDWQPFFSSLDNSIDERTARWAAQFCKDPDAIVPPRIGF